MSKIETTSKVSLKLTNRRNLGMQGARGVFDLGYSSQAKGLNQILFYCQSNFIKSQNRSKFVQATLLAAVCHRQFPQQSSLIETLETHTSSRSQMFVKIGVLRNFGNFIGKHCVKSVQLWSYFWSVFSCIRT